MRSDSQHLDEHSQIVWGDTVGTRTFLSALAWANRSASGGLEALPCAAGFIVEQIDKMLKATSQVPSWCCNLHTCRRVRITAFITILMAARSRL